jgi:transposase
MFTLSPKERRRLEGIQASSARAQQFQRAQALLWLDEGDPVEEVAERLRVSRQTLYNWRARLRARSELPVEQRLLDAARSGRPRTAGGIIDPLIDAILETDPRDLGYRSTVWTAALLHQYLAEGPHIEVSQRSVSYALARLGIRWKRPQYGLARQSPFWRQAKGGSNGGFPRGLGRSS